MTEPFWPLFRLRIRTPRLEIRLPTDDDLFKMIHVIDEGIHDESTMPFLQPWTDTPLPERHWESLKWWWSARANWQPEKWTFTGAVFVEGEPIGMQDIAGTEFAKLRSVSTGSWLGRRFQGQGLGKEMRSAALHFAFVGLGASEAVSGAFWDNAASLGTSRSLGYEDNGVSMALRRGVPDQLLRLRLSREKWLPTMRSDINIEGLSDCQAQFGI